MSAMNPVEQRLIDRLTSNTNKKQLIVMYYNGILLRTSSGKSSWVSIGAAKNALRNEAYHFSHDCRKTIDWKKLYSLIEFKEIC